MALIFFGPAHSAVGVNKSFDPISTAVNEPSTLTVSLFNSNTVAATGAAMVDSLPPGLLIANPPNASTTCAGGTVTAVAGSNSVALSGATVPPSSTGPGVCSFTVNVVAASGGTYLNEIPIGALTSSEGANAQAADASLTVMGVVPVIGSKAFSPTVAHGNGTSTLTITLRNNNTIALNNVAFTDNLPTQLRLAALPNPTTTCGAVVTAVADATSVSMTGGTIAPNSSCTVTVQVRPTTSNTYQSVTATNTIPLAAVTTAEGPAASNDAPFSANVAVQTGARIVKGFAASPVFHGTASTLTITIQNFNVGAAMPINFTDTLPAGVVPTGIASNTCGGTPSISGSAVSLTGGSVNAAPAGSGSTNCVLTVNYTANNPGGAAVTSTNGAAQFSGVDFGVVTPTVVAASVLINPVGNVYASKVFSGTPVQTGTVTLTITLRNGSATPAGITSFSDNLNTMGAGISIGITPPPSTTCGGTLNATVGATLISMTGGTIPAASTCTITVPVRIAGNAALTTRTNTIANGALVTTLGNTTSSATAAITVARALTVAKSFSVSPIASGLQNSTLTITLTRAAGATALTNLAFTDLLPTAPYTMVVAGAASTTCASGTVTAPMGGGSVSLSGAVLPAGVGGAQTSCTVTVPVTAPALSNGSATNTLAVGSVTSSNETVRNEAAASAVLVARDPSVNLAKGFDPTIVAMGGVAQLELQILNNSLGAINLTGVRLTDTLPSGMVVATPPAASFTGVGCTAAAATISAVAGSGTVALIGAGASITAGSVCTLTVNVRANDAGNLINNIPAGSLTSNQGPSNLNPVSATLSATGSGDLSVTKTNGVSQVTAGGTTVYTVVVRNAGPSSVAGAQFTDTPPAGMTFTSWTCVPSGGALCPAPSGSGPISGLVTLPASVGTVTFTVNAQIASSATGTITNTATVFPPSTVVDPNPANNTAPDTDTVIVDSRLSITKTDNRTTYAPGDTGTYVITVNSIGLSDSTGIAVTDTLPSGVTLTGTPTCTPTGSAICGTISGATGGSSFGATGASITAGSGNALTYSLPVRFASTLSTNPLVNTASATPAGGSSVSAQDSNSFLPRADLVVTKAATQPTDGTYLPGQALNYTVTVQNNGPSDLAGVNVSDNVPANVNVSTWTCAGNAGGACNGATVNSNGTGNNISLGNVTLPAGSAIAIIVTGTASPSALGDIVNSVTATPPATTSCTTVPCEKSATVTNTNAGTPQLTITKAATPTAFAVGQTGFYTLLVSNTGTSITSGTITVTDTLPPGITATGLPTGTGWDCSTSTTTAITCTRTAALLFSTSAPSISIPVSIAAVVSSPATNTAVVRGGGDAQCPVTGTLAPHCQGTVVTPVNAPSFNVSKTLQNSALVADVPNAYVITATNNGQAATLAGFIDDVVPSTLAIGTLPAGCLSTGGQGVRCDVPAGVLTGGQVSYTLPVTPLSSAVGQAANNTATVTGGGDPACPTGTNCSGNSSGTITAPQLLITKRAEPSTLVVGQSANYILTISNNGGAATNAAITVSDVVPTGLTLGSMPSGCGATGQTVSCTISSLAINGTTSFTIPVTAQNSINGQSIQNTASATGGGDPGCPVGTPLASLPARCQGSVTTPISAPQLTLTKTASDNFAVGVAGSYVLRVENTGSAATVGDISVIDVIPASLTIGTLPSGCVRSGQQVTCTQTASLAQRGSVSFTIPVTPTAAAAPSVSNTATVLGGGDPVCPNAVNCTSTVVRDVNAPQLQITNSANGPWTIGQTGAVLTLTVNNVGAASTTGTMTVLNTLPAGIVPGWTGTQTFGNWSCTAAGQTVSCTSTTALANGATSSIPLPMSITAPLATAAPSQASVAGGGDPFNNSVTPAPGSACTTLDPAAPGHCAELLIAVPAGASVTASKTLAPGTAVPLTLNQTVSYVLTATNTGGTPVTGYSMNEVVPTGTRWVSVSGGTSACAAGATAGTLCNISFPVVSAGASVSVTVTFQVLASVPASLSQIVNAATAPASCTGATCEAPPTPPNCSGSTCTPAAQCTAGDPLCVRTSLTGGGGSSRVEPVPSVSELGLMLMSLLVALMGWGSRRRMSR
ncbi:IPTL-CTERM sorting domain-containing protein [Ottowia thiooxydans]|uniref:IPTL-CTERM sorting domain-containing protein n=1 Tax=Ottowia thiooxydans TaxID=219182 RepID=UPI001B7FC482|nr:IPTL-CTERM sorting domain-containing protein [Ottowia thiooxydans]